MQKFLIVLNLPPPVRNMYEQRLRSAFPQLHIDVVIHHSDAGPFIGEADMVLAFGVMLSDEIFSKGKNLKWVQALGSGVDGIVDQPSFRDEIIVTNMQGVHGPPCAEAALSAMFALARSMPRILQNQREKRWERFPVQLLDGKQIAIIGLGVIAEALAPRCQAMGMKVTGVTGTPRDIPGFDHVASRDSLLEVAAQSDFIVLLTPYTRDNHHLVGSKFLSVMKKTGYLINIARGGVVDEEALIAAVKKQDIAGAALDVFSTEPLPDDNPLWEMENILITPHLGGFHDEYPKRALPIIEHNITKFLAGDTAAMINVVNSGKGSRT